MGDIDRETALARIKKTQETIAVAIGTTVVIILLGYFFVYAQLADRGFVVAFWTMLASILLWVLILFKLKQISFFFTRLWLGRRPELRDIFAGLRAADL